jgi:STAM-binding protein
LLSHRSSFRLVLTDLPSPFTLEMEARSSMRPSRPQTVPELVDRAENFTFNANIPFKHWARTAETLYQEVRLCNLGVLAT